MCNEGSKQIEIEVVKEEVEVEEQKKFDDMDDLLKLNSERIHYTPENDSQPEPKEPV